MGTRPPKQNEVHSSPPCIEQLENRRLLSATPVAPPVIANIWQTRATADDLFQQNLSDGNPATQYTVPNAPKGMAYNSTTGVLSWTPTESQVGKYALTVVATNSAGTATEPFQLTVFPDVPRPFGGVISSTSTDGSGTVGLPMTIAVYSGAPTAGMMSIVSGPKGVTINPTTGVINWTPTAADAGNVTIVVQSKNRYGTGILAIPVKINAAPAVIHISVTTNGLAAPTMSWTQPTNKDVKITGYNIILKAYGPNGEKTFAFNRDSSATSFQLHGLPGGYYGFIPTITPLDAAGHKGIAATGSAFKYAEVLPKITVSAAALSVEPFDQLTFSISVGDAATYSLMDAPSGLSFIGYNGYDTQVTWTPDVSQVGTHIVKISATSQWGTSTQSVQITVLPPLPAQPKSIWVSDVSNTGVTISWKPSVDAAWVVGYTITVKYSNDTITQFGNLNLIETFNVKSNVLTYHFATPKLGQFAIRVTSINSLGEGNYNPYWASAGNTIDDPIT